MEKAKTSQVFKGGKPPKTSAAKAAPQTSNKTRNERVGLNYAPAKSNLSGMPKIYS